MMRSSEHHILDAGVTRVPPSNANSVPVKYEPALLQRKMQAPAASSGDPNLFNAVVLAMLSAPAVVIVPRIMRDMKGPGQMELTVMCCSPNTDARCLDNIT